MATKGIDCAAPLTYEKAKAIREAGYVFACRYLVPEKYAWKRLTRGEAEALTKAGLKIVSVFETTASRPKGGAKAGAEDGELALREAFSVGQMKGTAIYFAVDYNAQPSEFDTIEQYLRAAERVIAPYGYVIGVYGSFRAVKEMASRIPAIRVWQTYAWSGGQKFEGRHIYQYKNGQTVAGHPVDLNESYGGEMWWDLNYLQQGEGEEDMELKPWQWQMLEDNIDVFLDKKLITDEAWMDKVRTRQMTADELAWLVSVVVAKMAKKV